MVSSSGVGVVDECFSSSSSSSSSNSNSNSNSNNSDSTTTPIRKVSLWLACSIFSDVAGDITVLVEKESFLLHKFPLVSRSGRIRKMVAETNDSNLSKLELPDFPGGSQAFELAMKFCYGMNFEITTENVAYIRCAAEYLEMTENYKEENLIARTEAYLSEIVVQSLEKSVKVLSSCESLPYVVEEYEIPNRCVEAIAMKACKEQLVSDLSKLECDSGSKNGCLGWWIEDLSVLRIDYYGRVISALSTIGVRPDNIIASLMHYAQASLKGIGKCQIWHPVRLKPNSGTEESDQRAIVEEIVSLMPTEKKYSIPMSFLFGLLRMAVMVDAKLACRVDLEKRIAYRLEMVSLDYLFIPSIRFGDPLFDVDTIHRILISFLQQIDEEEKYDFGYESEGFGSPSHGSLLKVGRLVDAYLAEIAPDHYLSLQKFIAMIEVLPDYARVIDDGLYRAVDIYLKAHPMLTDQECKKLCKFIDCQKLSQEACNHAAHNDRLPVQMTVRILYAEQLRLKNSLTGNSGEGFYSQKINSGIPSAAMSPRDNYASLRRENRELKLEISRMRVRLSELEKEQMFMKKGMIEKSSNGKTFFTSLSKGIGRIGIFNNQAGGKHQKSGKKSKGSEVKTGRSRMHSLSSIKKFLRE